MRNRYSITRENAYRVIFGEADGLPGLIVDKFDEYLTIQFNTLGINKLKNLILEVLVEIFSPAGIFERTEGNAVKKEGLEDSQVGFTALVQNSYLLR